MTTTQKAGDAGQAAALPVDADLLLRLGDVFDLEAEIISISEQAEDGLRRCAALVRGRR